MSWFVRLVSWQIGQLSLSLEKSMDHEELDRVYGGWTLPQVVCCTSATFIVLGSYICFVGGALCWLQGAAVACLIMYLL